MLLLKGPAWHVCPQKCTLDRDEVFKVCFILHKRAAYAGCLFHISRAPVVLIHSGVGVALWLLAGKGAPLQPNDLASAWIPSPIAQKYTLPW